MTACTELDIWYQKC